MYKLKLKKGELIHIRTANHSLTLEGGNEYDQAILEALYNDGLKAIVSKTKEKE